MKNSMQVIAIAAFLGCFVIMAIAAGGGKSRLQEGCGEEWYEGDEPRSRPVNEKAAKQPEKEVSVHWQDNRHELIFPAQLFYQVI